MDVVECGRHFTFFSVLRRQISDSETILGFGGTARILVPGCLRGARPDGAECSSEPDRSTAWLCGSAGQLQAWGVPFWVGLKEDF